MTCKTCKFWNADGTQMVIALRGKCSESRADKISERTVFDYSCRYYQRRPTPRALDVGVCACENVDEANRGTWLVCGQCLKPRRQ